MQEKRQSIDDLKDTFRQSKGEIIAAMQNSGPSTRGMSKLLLRLSQLADKTLQSLWVLAAFAAD